MRPIRVALYTLGCKVNQFETQAMEKLLLEHGHRCVPPGAEADACVVNTCSVTSVSDRKSRQVIRRVRRDHPNAVIAVCGCYGQIAPDKVRALGVDLLGGTGDRAGFVALLEQVTAERIARRETAQSGAFPDTACAKGGADSAQSGVSPDIASADDSPARDSSPSSAALPEALDRPRDRHTFEVLPAGRLGGRTRAVLKVEDGCANFCTYCIIPYTRGPVRSAPLETVLEQAGTLAAENVREIVLTGIEISSWGRDLRNGQTLTDLTEALCTTFPQVRFRLGSLEPRTITEDFCRRTAALPNLCPQFHLSLQSGCDATLRRMGRRYDTARYFQSVTLLRQYFPRPALTTDLITGFPGETEEEFSQTLDFLRKCAFAKVHVFPYSPRPGTPAAAMPQVPPSVREERVHRAADVARQTRRDWLAGCVGAVYDVLFETPEAGMCAGHAPNYAEVRVPLPQGADLRNTIRPVRIISTDGERLFGELADTPVTLNTTNTPDTLDTPDATHPAARPNNSGGTT